KTVLFPPFFTFFQSRNSGYASSKTQKLTKKAQVFDSVRKSPTYSYDFQAFQPWVFQNNCLFILKF
ncbi:MAG: hypothetical protein J0M29_13105, partial [Chitinophagales bacterium]|nr:hypothetical protein [Chitinophagales bacterium]